MKSRNSLLRANIKTAVRLGGPMLNREIAEEIGLANQKPKVMGAVRYLVARSELSEHKTPGKPNSTRYSLPSSKLADMRGMAEKKAPIRTWYVAPPAEYDNAPMGPVGTTQPKESATAEIEILLTASGKLIFALPDDKVLAFSVQQTRSLATMLRTRFDVT